MPDPENCGVTPSQALAHVKAILHEQDKRYEQRFAAQEEAIRVAREREQNYLSKSMGVVLLVLTAATLCVGLVAIFYKV